MNAPTNAAGVATAAQLYKKHATETREAYLKRARACAEVTVPALMPPEGYTGQDQLKTPWQSVGARGVNNLSSKLFLAQFPSEVSFFKVSPTQEIKDQLEAAGMPEGEVNAALQKVEQTALEDMETSGDRSPLFEVFRQLIVSGNALLYIPPKGGDARVFRLDRYVTKRDLAGNVIDLIVEEGVTYEALDEDLRAMIDGDVTAKAEAMAGRPIMLYTRVHRDGKVVRQYQELAGQRVPKSEGNWPPELSPWLVLRMIAVPGEDYGRSYVEEYLGDLDSLELLQKALVEGTIGAARFFLLVSPHGTTKLKAVQDAENGAIINGNAEDITTYRAEKANDLSVGRTLAQEIETRLEFAFLMHSAIQRNAERVTAEEIRYMAEELDATLGGVYTILSQELQLPYVRLRINRLQKSGKLPNWPRKSLKLSISTGLDAIGRGRDVQRLRSFVKGISEAFGAEAAAKHLSISEYSARFAAGIGLNPKGLVLDAQQVEDEAADEANHQAMQNMAPDAIRAGSQIAAASMKQQEQPAQ